MQKGIQSHDTGTAWLLKIRHQSPHVPDQVVFPFSNMASFLNRFSRSSTASMFDEKYLNYEVKSYCCIFSILRCLKLNPNSKHSNAKPVHTARGLHRTHSCHLWRIHQLSQTLSSFGWAILRCNPTTIWPKRSCPKLSNLQLNHFRMRTKIILLILIPLWSTSMVCIIMFPPLKYQPKVVRQLYRQITVVGASKSTRSVSCAEKNIRNLCFHMFPIFRHTHFGSRFETSGRFCHVDARAKHTSSIFSSQVHIEGGAQDGHSTGRVATWK